MPDVVTMDKIVALCKRRGFIFPASEIYGGIANTYDYGHYGVLLKRNVIDAWWQAMVQERDDIVALDSAIIQHPRTWEASGHLAGFTDPLVDCRTCKLRFRADHLEEARAGAPGARSCAAAARRPSSPASTRDCDLTEARAVQPDVRDDDRAGEGRRLDRLPAPGDRAGHLPRLQDRAAVRAPEAAVRDRAGRQVVPQRDHARQLHLPHARVRADGDGVLRPARRGASAGTSTGCRSAWTGTRGWASGPTTCACARTTPDELSHYSSAHQRRRVPVPDRLVRSSRASPTAATSTSPSTREFSGEKLEYKDPQTGERYVPHVIEPAAGVGRTRARVLCDAYDEDEIGGEPRTVLRLHPALAPVKVAVLPLLRKDGHPEKAREVYEALRRRIAAEYDEGGAIGRRYRRQDEIGTPYAVTIDHQTLEDDTVTLRERDSLEQDRVAIDGLPGELERAARAATGDRRSSTAAARSGRGDAGRRRLERLALGVHGVPLVARLVEAPEDREAAGDLAVVPAAVDRRERERDVRRRPARGLRDDVGGVDWRSVVAKPLSQASKLPWRLRSRRPGAARRRWKWRSCEVGVEGADVVGRAVDVERRGPAAVAEGSAGVERAGAAGWSASGVGAGAAALGRGRTRVRADCRHAAGPGPRRAAFCLRAAGSAPCAAPPGGAGGGGGARAREQVGEAPAARRRSRSVLAVQPRTRCRQLDRDGIASAIGRERCDASRPARATVSGPRRITVPGHAARAIEAGAQTAGRSACPVGCPFSPRSPAARARRGRSRPRPAGRRRRSPARAGRRTASASRAPRAGRRARSTSAPVARRQPRAHRGAEAEHARAGLEHELAAADLDRPQAGARRQRGGEVGVADRRLRRCTSVAVLGRRRRSRARQRPEARARRLGVEPLRAARLVEQVGEPAGAGARLARCGSRPSPRGRTAA